MKDIPLQGSTSRFDYQTFDAHSQRLYIAHLGDGTATVYDTGSGAVVGKIYVSDEHGATDSVIDTRTNQTVAKIQVGDDVGYSVFDPGSHRILVAIGSSNQLVAIDPTTDKVVGATDLPGCQGAHGLAIDGDAHLAFAACAGNAKLVCTRFTKHARRLRR